jgi:hypothetical protein
MYSVCFKKDFAKRFLPSSFVIRHSIFCGSLFSPAVSCQSNRVNHQEIVPFWRSFIRAAPLAKKTASLIEKETLALCYKSVSPIKLLNSSGSS